MAIAPPAHIEISAVDWSRALELVERGRDQPDAGRADRVTERDRAAVDVDLVHVDAVDAGPRQDDGREGLVDLEQVEVADRHAGLVEHPLGGVDRAVEVVVGVGADQAVELDPRSRLEAEGVGPVLVHDHERRGAVGDLGRRAGGVEAVGQHGLEAGEALERGLAEPLVGVDDAGLAGRLALVVEHRRLDRRDLALEPALVDGDPRLLLGRERRTPRGRRG